MYYKSKYIEALIATFILLCFQEKSEQHVQVNIDGKTLSDTVYKDDNLQPITLAREMGLGGSHEGASVEWGLFGKVADLNIWTRILTQSEIQSFTDIKVNPTGCNDILQSGIKFL